MNEKPKLNYAKPEHNFSASQKIDFVFYENEKLVPNLFDTNAKQIAETFFVNGPREKACVSGSQLRKLFDEVKRYERLIDANKNAWNEQQPFIKLLKSKTAYQVSRAIKNNPKLESAYKNVEHFISRGIDLVKTEKDYHVFVSLFEAVYGFYYASACDKGLKI